MKYRRNLDIKALGFIGSILIIISEFLPWFSNHNLLEIYIFTTIVELERSFLYLYPLISGIICLISSLLIMYDDEYRINSVIVSFIGLGFLTLFIFEILPEEGPYLMSIGIGLYFCVVGFIIIIIDIILILLSKEH